MMHTTKHIFATALIAVSFSSITYARALPENTTTFVSTRAIAKDTDIGNSCPPRIDAVDGLRNSDRAKLASLVDAGISGAEVNIELVGFSGNQIQGRLNTTVTVGDEQTAVFAAYGVGCMGDKTVAEVAQIAFRCLRLKYVNGVSTCPL